jgi:hypothetical protein
MAQAPCRLAMLTLAAILAMPMVAPLACRVPRDVSLSAPDTERMKGFDAARTRGLAEALLADDAGEREVVSGLFSARVETFDTIPDGSYRCRTIKLGGLLPLVVYDYFSCEISLNGTQIDKVSGSQRFSGSLAPTNGGLFYRGALHYNDDPALAYGAEPDRDQVGCLYRVAGTELYRLEMPFPLRESTHDVIELLPEH